MHLSLKGSMDRQPLLDRLGDKLLPTYPGAAAAYSLQALNGNGDNVVRVRRESDNDERDFTALEVNSGELQNWVNSQIVPPLDIGVETADGRIPTTEGGTSIGTPAAAYSLRNLSTTYTGNVVEVRRSSDDAERDFTAAELADGTLEDWVNANDVHYSTTFANNLDGWALETGGWTGTASFTHNAANDARLAVTATGVSSGARRPAIKLPPRPSNILAGENYSFEIDYEVISGTVVLLDENIDGTPDYANPVTLTGSGTLTIDAKPFNSTTPFFYFDGDNHTFELSIKGIRFKSTVANGHVSTWYDQSGNDNHATQADTANQPKIVDAGTLVTGGLDFDGVDDEMDIGGLVLASLNYGAFSVASIDNPTASTLKTIFDSTETNKAGFALAYGNTASKLTPFWFDGDDTTANVFGSGSNLTSSESLYSAIIKSGASTTHINGSLNETLTNTWTTAGTNSFTKSTIGYDQSVSGRNFKGKLKELIIYDSDQSANRAAIETNINNRYNIYS